MRTHIITTTKLKLLFPCISLLMLTGCSNCNQKIGLGPEYLPERSRQEEQNSYSQEEQHKFEQAAYTGTPEELKAVLKSKQGSIDINKTDPDGRTLLHNFLGYMKTQNRAEKVKLLIDYGADLSVTDKYSRNLIHEATYGGDVKLTQHVLEKLEEKLHPSEVEKMLNQAEGSLGCTPFIYAIQGGDMELIKLLDQKGAAPTKKELAQALKHSISKSKLDMVKYLLDERGGGMDVLLEDKPEGASTRGITILHQAAKTDCEDLVDYLINKEVLDIHAEDELGMTALHYAALNNKRNSLSALLKKGAAINAQRTDGKTALHLASEQVHRDAVSTLLSHKAAINLKDSAGKTALDLAQQKRSSEDNSMDIQFIIRKLKSRVS